MWIGEVEIVFVCVHVRACTCVKKGTGEGERISSKAYERFSSMEDRNDNVSEGMQKNPRPPIISGI